MCVTTQAHIDLYLF